MVVRQEEVTRLNQEGARLVSDLSHARKALHDEQANGRELVRRLQTLQETEQRARVVEIQLAEKTALSARLAEQISAVTGQAEESSRRIRELELSLATAQAKQEAQQTLNDELRSYLKHQIRTVTDEGK